ncbi:uncharacterized protein BJ212DRAFT_1304133 [Suillus subaureus]|uniref:Uncharacterized protein n=1 Tax=Suillus subaureus TaxID=48587 RepID=A0A9P7DX85_9AGAM|nr:uncharacterized protein BJ212DRAFT_1304133 [Suillus subaureus]KAG1805169.1 hypothetical protein BJ212DRAFT_1304133 [Suillus subaureus]
MLTTKKQGAQYNTTANKPRTIAEKKQEVSDKHPSQDTREARGAPHTNQAKTSAEKKTESVIQEKQEVHHTKPSQDQCLKKMESVINPQTQDKQGARCHTTTNNLTPDPTDIEAEAGGAVPHNHQQTNPQTQQTLRQKQGAQCHTTANKLTPRPNRH